MPDSIAAQQHLFDPPPPVKLTLNDRFIVPPFSVLDARAGYWQKRKQDWISLGIKSELGRDDRLLGFDSLTGNDRYRGFKGRIEHGTSIFDPVLCEAVYRWFAPPHGRVLDPFAGGSVRGIVASALGRRYLGIELRAEQIASNIDQVADIATKHPLDPPPEWALGDSRRLPEVIGSHRFDFAFTCPPYYYLERYSQDPRDLSNMPEWADFRKAYREVVAHTAAALVDNSFAVWVVGEIRKKTKPGTYFGLVPTTIQAFRDAGMRYYNEIILITAVGTAAVRVSSQFGVGRKVGKVHQNVLVFVKGDPELAAAKVPVGELPEVQAEEAGATWYADGSLEIEESGEKFEPSLEEEDAIPY
jgi:DNA modification methylase